MLTGGIRLVFVVDHAVAMQYHESQSRQNWSVPVEELGGEGDRASRMNKNIVERELGYRGKSIRPGVTPE